MKVKCFKIKSSLIGVAFFILYQGCASASDTVSTYQSLVKDWLSLEKQSSALKKDWRQKKPILKQRIKLLNAEKIVLTKQLAAQSSKKSTVENKRSQLITQQNKAEKEQKKIVLWLANQWQKIQETSTQIAPPLFNSWQQQMNTYNDDLTASDKLSIVLSLWQKKKQFDQKITQVKSVITTSEGKEVLVEQLYIGSGLGWYVSADGSEYGLGKSVPGGWQWHKLDVDISHQVKQSIAMYRLQDEAGFISFPFTLLDAGGVTL